MGNIVKAQETKRHGWSWSGMKQLPRGLFLLERFSQISILVQSRGAEGYTFDSILHSQDAADRRFASRHPAPPK
jgi:hypothetical protein